MIYFYTQWIQPSNRGASRIRDPVLTSIQENVGETESNETEWADNQENESVWNESSNVLTSLPPIEWGLQSNFNITTEDSSSGDISDDESSDSESSDSTILYNEQEYFVYLPAMEE